MYGTVAKIRVADGRLEDLLQVMKEWDTERAPNVKGAVAGYTYQLDADPNELILVAVFEDKKTYEANADDPAQDAWYQKMRACLAADPEWMDGQIIQSS